MDLAEAEDENAVTLDDGVDTMGDDDHGRVGELSVDEQLDLLLGDDIDIGGGFVQDDHL